MQFSRLTQRLVPRVARAARPRRALPARAISSRAVARALPLRNVRSVLATPGHAYQPSLPQVHRIVRAFSTEDLPSHVQLEMPALSPSMEQGNLVSWNIKEGDAFVAGDVIAEIETDKAVMAWEATDDGVLAKILVPGGTEGVKIGQIVAIVVEEEADVAAFKDYTPDEGELPAQEEAHEESSPPPPGEPEASPEPSVQPKSKVPPGSIQDASGDRIIASPRARRLARERNVDLANIRGTGSDGRITESDVRDAAPQSGDSAPAEAPKQAKTAPPVVAGDSAAEYEDVSVTNIRKVIAKRLLESKNTIPHYYLTSDMCVDELLALRKELNERGGDNYKVSVNDFVIKAAALALKKVPDANSAWMGDQIRRYHNVHINVAVSTDNGLYSPLVANVQNKGLVEINAAVQDLATKARANKLHANELQSGTFTISNLGMFGIKNFTAVINPPQACILACGGVEKRVIPQGDGFGVASYLTVTLSCDHRVVDGAVGAQWLKHFKQYMEKPVTMLL